MSASRLSEMSREPAKTQKQNDREPTFVCGEQSPVALKCDPPTSTLQRDDQVIIQLHILFSKKETTSYLI